MSDEPNDAVDLESDGGVDEGLETAVDDGQVDAGEVSALSDEIMSRAQGYGLSSDDLNGLDDDRANRLFGAMDRRLMAGTTPAAEPAIASAPATPAEQGFKPFELSFGEDIDEAVSGPMKGFVDSFNGQMQELHQFRQQLVSEVNSINMIRELDGFDAHINSLGEEWKGVYGSGSTLDMDQQSAEFQKRMEVFNGGRSLEGDATRNGQRLRRSDMWSRSHFASNGDRIAEMERKKLGTKINERSKQFGVRQTPGTKTGMSPRDEAIAALKE